MKEMFATSKNGQQVWYDSETSHATTHFVAQPELRQHVIGAVQNTDLTDDQDVYFQYDMGRVIGTSDLVETNEDGEIIYAKRVGRDVYTRFVKNREPQPMNLISIILQKIPDGYDLVSAWIGPKVPQFPGDPKETPDSKEFWSKHALVWGNQPIIPGTETAECPW